MDINPTLVIHYFKTKESLIYALIDYILERYLLIYTIKQKEQAILADLHKTIEMLFSNKWNSLFDDGLFYAFYAKTFRDEKIKAKYKIILDTLRTRLISIIEQCNSNNFIKVDDPKVVADIIFVLVDGSYFYLSLEKDKIAVEEKLNFYKGIAYEFLGLKP